MKYCIILTLLLCSCSRYNLGAAYFNDSKLLSDEEAYTLYSKFNRENFNVFYKKKDLPKAFFKTLKFKIADHGGAYNATDFIRRQRLPSRQIISILKSNKYLVLYYKHGGRGLHRHVVLYDLTKSRSEKNIWIGDSQLIINSKETLLYAVQNAYLKKSSCY